MKIIKEHIKRNQYKSVYLIYGSESYLKKLYRDKLRNGIINNSDTMNYSYFEGKSIDSSKIKAIAETMPFFSERRLIILENSNWFKSQSYFEDYLKQLPNTTHIVFVESEIDKRSRLFKTIKEIGYISEMNTMDERNLKLFAASLFQKEKKLITEKGLSLFLETVGTDMNMIINEVEKLICYTLGKDVVSEEDIYLVCTELITNKIFLMIDAIAQKNQQKALQLYYDLIVLREKPLSILFLINRHFHILYQVKELSSLERDNKSISNKVSIPPFAVSKYISQLKGFTMEQIKEMMEYGITIEENIKTGRIDEKMGVELMIIHCSS